LRASAERWTVSRHRPAIPGLADPALPEVRRQGEQLVGLAGRERPDLAAPFQLDVHGLALVQGERRGDAGLLDLQRHVGPQHEAAGGRLEHRADAGHHFDGVRGPAVVERRVAGQLEGGPATHSAGLPDQQVACLAGAAGLRHHEVDHLADRFRAVEPGQQDVRVGKVKLLRARITAARQREVTALARIQERAEERGSVKARRAIPIDRAVRADERHGPQVTDDSVLFDRQVARRRSPATAGAG